MAAAIREGVSVTHTPELPNRPRPVRPVSACPSSPAVQLLPGHHAPHTDAGVLLLVDIAMVTGYPQMADRGEPPVLIQLRDIGQNTATAQHVTQLLHLQTAPLEVGTIAASSGLSRARAFGPRIQ